MSIVINSYVNCHNMKAVSFFCIIILSPVSITTI